MVINLTSPNLNQRVSETFASTLGIVISFVAVGASITIATMMDYFRKKMKLAICSLLAAAGFIFIFCTLIAEEVIVFESHNLFKGVLSTLLVLGISLCSACAPIAFEFCVELCYPTAEGTIGGIENISSLSNVRHLAHTLVQLPCHRLLPCLPDTRRELAHPPLNDASFDLQDTKQHLRL